MTPKKDKVNTGTLEHILDAVGNTVSEIRGIVRGMYDKVNDLIESTDAIYDTLAYHRNHVGYPAEDGYDLFGDMNHD